MCDGPGKNASPGYYGPADELPDGGELRSARAAYDRMLRQQRTQAGSRPDPRLASMLRGLAVWAGAVLAVVAVSLAPPVVEQIVLGVMVALIAVIVVAGAVAAASSVRHRWRSRRRDGEN
ncbi:hypothetical protein [Thermomonospora cellulosilytica]|uniref:Flp pilus assembly protein TadB n=1 Tax=Thermomonospora cellulosilytica TaxID=1411118 RepID=A0A7W3RAH7_9ACTN|nr:hypothetical protein [Thermomonospora cellulosilytica]MBA9005866.1 Flp pilus assembly protein TadB [Thermomonospora cellulosilytica]